MYFFLTQNVFSLCTKTRFFSAWVSEIAEIETDSALKMMGFAFANVVCCACRGNYFQHKYNNGIGVFWCILFINKNVVKPKKVNYFHARF